MNNILRWLCIAAAGAAVSAGAQAQTELRLLNGFDNRYSATPLVVEKYAETIKRETGGRISIRIHGPEVVSGFEQFQPVSKGAFDMLFTVPSYHLGTSAVSHALQALEPQPELWRTNGVYEFADKEYQRHNLKLLAIISNTLPGKGVFHAMLKQPLGPAGDLAGRKLRGNSNYQGIAETMGASMVVLQGGEVYSALQRGVIDGVFFSVLGSTDFKWYEQGRFMTRPRFGYGLFFLLMNVDRFNKLGPADQRIFVEEGRKLEISSMKVLDQRTDQEEADLLKHGVKETPFNKDKFDKASQAHAEGLWKTALASKASGEQVRALLDLVRSKGLWK